MPYLLNNGHSIYYYTCGSGYPVVFIHGYVGSIYKHWRYQFNNPILKDNFQLIGLDLRGFGKSAKHITEIHKTREFLSDLRKLLKKQLKVNKSIFIGYSVGATLSLLYALLYPKEVQAILLVSPSPFLNSEMRTWKTSSDDGSVKRALFFQKVIWYLIKIINFNLLKVRTKKIKQKPTEFLKNLYRISKPILIVSGTKDSVTPSIAFDLLINFLPSQTKIISLPFDHGISHEEPEIFNKILYNFCTNNSRKTN